MGQSPNVQIQSPDMGWWWRTLINSPPIVLMPPFLSTVPIHSRQSTHSELQNVKYFTRKIFYKPNLTQRKARKSRQIKDLEEKYVTFYFYGTKAKHSIIKSWFEDRI